MEGDLKATTTTTSATKKTCFKCKEKANMKYKNNLSICGDCFSFYLCLRNFRSVVRMQHDIHGKENSLVAFFDGTLNSVMMVHNLSMSVKDNEKIKKKMFIQPKVIFLDFFALDLQIFGSEKASNLSQNRVLFCQFMEELQLPYEILKIEDFENLGKLAEQFAKIPKIGGYKYDFLKILEHRVFLSYCFTNNYKRSILSENAEQLAARSLKLLCKSRQNALVQNCAVTHVFFSDKKQNAMTAVRPLSERNDKEVYFYCFWNKIVKFAVENYAWIEKDSPERAKSLPGEGSINNLLVEFITDLQSEYISTCSTILKTVEKVKEKNAESVLTKSPNGNKEEEIDWKNCCDFCLVVS